LSKSKTKGHHVEGKTLGKNYSKEAHVEERLRRHIQEELKDTMLREDQEDSTYSKTRAVS
jgi:hypothetical protein